MYGVFQLCTIAYRLRGRKFKSLMSAIPKLISQDIILLLGEIPPPPQKKINVYDTFDTAGWIHFISFKMRHPRWCLQITSLYLWWIQFRLYGFTTCFNITSHIRPALQSGMYIRFRIFGWSCVYCLFHSHVPHAPTTSRSSIRPS